MPAPPHEGHYEDELDKSNFNTRESRAGRKRNILALFLKKKIAQSTSFALKCIKSSPVLFRKTILDAPANLTGWIIHPVRNFSPFERFLNPYSLNLSSILTEFSKPSRKNFSFSVVRFFMQSRMDFSSEIIKKAHLKSGAPENRPVSYSFLCKLELAFKHIRPCVFCKRFSRKMLCPYHNLVCSCRKLRMDNAAQRAGAVPADFIRSQPYRL